MKELLVARNAGIQLILHADAVKQRPTGPEEL